MAYKQDLAQFAALNKIVEDYHKILMKKYEDSYFTVLNRNHSYFELGEKYKISGFIFSSGIIYVEYQEYRGGITRTINLEHVEIVP